MDNVRKTFFCALLNLKKWKSTTRIYIFFIVSFILILNVFYDVNILVDIFGVKCTPWLFPFIHTNVSTNILYFALIAVVYSNAPFEDSNTQFVITRTGKRNWIVGQIVYVYISAFIITLFYIIVPVLIIFSNMDFSFEWGKLLMLLGNENSFIEIIRKYNVELIFYPDVLILERYSPIVFMLIYTAMFWLTTVFSIMVIMTFNIVVKKTAGIIADGFLIAMTYVILYFGTLMISPKIYYFSPLAWVNIHNVDWLNLGTIQSPAYSFAALIIGIIIMTVVSITVFCKKDVYIEKGEF